MPSYVAMLRGINVSGSKMIKMEALRASFEALGFTNVRTYVQSGNVVLESTANPFLGKKGVDPAKLHVTFLAETPASSGLEKMQAISSGRDQFQCLGTSIYLVCPDGYGNTKLNNNAFERALRIGATTRNWKTVTTLAQMAAEG